MKQYIGLRTANGAEVWVLEEDGRRYPLDLRLDIVPHSPTGFEWGYGGSGPAQLALAILADFVGDEVAKLFYQRFKFDVIANLHTNDWVLPEEKIWEWFCKPEIVKRLVKYVSLVVDENKVLKDENNYLWKIAERR